MRQILAFLIVIFVFFGFFLFSVAADAGTTPPPTTLNASYLGVTDEVLLDADGLNVSATTNAIPMSSGSSWSNQLMLVVEVTWGTTTQFSARCYSSPTSYSPTYGVFPVCDSAADCVAKDKTFYAASFPDYPSAGKTRIAMHWANAGKQMLCQFWSTAGNGTVSVLKGARSKQ